MATARTSPGTTPVDELLARWRAEAELLRRYGHAATAAACELHAREVAAVLSAVGAEQLTLSEAAAESGFSEEHLGRLVREGKLPNVGRRGAPRIRRADLPLKVREQVRRQLASTDNTSYDPVTDARSLLSRR
jgi:hypothetical protein